MNNQEQIYTSLYREKAHLLLPLPNGELKTFLAALTLAEYNTNTLLFNGHNKKRMAELTGFKEQSIRVHLVFLAKKNYVLRIRNHLYQINPTIAFYGSEGEREKLVSGEDWEVKKDFKIKKQ